MPDRDSKRVPLTLTERVAAIEDLIGRHFNDNGEFTCQHLSAESASFSHPRDEGAYVEITRHVGLRVGNGRTERATLVRHKDGASGCLAIAAAPGCHRYTRRYVVRLHA